MLQIKCFFSFRARKKQIIFKKAINLFRKIRILLIESAGDVPYNLYYVFLFIQYVKDRGVLENLRFLSRTGEYSFAKVFFLFIIISCIYFLPLPIPKQILLGRIIHKISGTSLGITGGFKWMR
jgi:hypothetical protein